MVLTSEALLRMEMLAWLSHQYSVVWLVPGHGGGVVILFEFSTEARRTFRPFIRGLLTALCETG